MTVNAIVSIKTCQKTPDGENFDMEMMCDAEYIYSPDKCTLRYNEPEGSGLGKTETFIEIDDESITLTRSGENNSKMHFKTGEKHTSVYEMPFGMFTININSKYVEVSRYEEGAYVAAEYTLELEGIVSSENKLELDIKRKM